MAGGRPTDYDPKYCQEILEYFGVKPYEQIGDEQIANDLPSLAGFACKIGVHRDTLHQWTTEHKEFSDAVRKAKDFQQNFLLVNGNKGLINTAFGMFTLKNLQGFKDKQPDEVEKTVVNNIQVQGTDLEDRLKQIKGEE